MTDLQRDIGRMESEIENIKEALNEVRKDVKQIGTTLAEAQGGWRLLIMLSGASATIGGLIVKFAPYLSSIGPK